ncbi:hypothetical protein AARI_30360 [Glutamicibacter arilaitensis Re117]|uniref:HNH endonuclease n=1 Tax=Glutamicibacter arilaitensis (strain DSM 16368 / CIP 108037 / IAM 15318 / JCM 13566 / NCIMB 14258 / Re117) TaxID=861360 RepID=A0ABP1U5J5_GLUAR|nr:hypothetical protein AARI_30360 [Glutamicibacter arilaitensis Re117]
MNSSTSIWESAYQRRDNTDQLRKSSAAASAASSPGRRAQTSPPVPNPWDVFTHQGKPHRFMRMQPGDYPGEPIRPHEAVTAMIHTHAGAPKIPAHATARTPHLVHVIWEDEKGETYGTWLPNLSVRFDSLRPKPTEQE